MPIVNDVGMSQHTVMKEQGLERILSLHLRIAGNIISRRRRYTHPLYHWYDINAGNGINLDCPGSPLVFLETAQRLGIPYRATFIEQNEHNVDQLRDCIGERSNVYIKHGDNRVILPMECGQLNGRLMHYGMIYTDPNGEPSFDLLAGVSRFPGLSKIDILIYLSGTSLKRIRHQRQMGLLEHLATIAKNYWLVRDVSTSGQWQWTFLLGTNWADFPEYRREGFYRTETDEGAHILHVLATTKAEREHESQMPMFTSYSTYQEYLAHPQYRAVRQEAINRSGGTCERCHSRPVTEVHHLRYPVWGTFEADASGLQAICHQCHCEIEGKEN